MPAALPVRLLATAQAGVLLVALGVVATSGPPSPPERAVAPAGEPVPQQPAELRLLPRPDRAAAPAPTAAPPARADRRREPAPASFASTAARARPVLDLTPTARGRAALGRLGYDWRRLGYSLRFLPYAGGRLGTANSKKREITIYVGRYQSELSLRTTLAHELGHALDFGHGTAQRRDAYREIRGLSRSSPWFPCNRCDDLSSPAGDFAESFAVWLVGPGEFRGRLRPAPDARQLRELRELFTVPEPRKATPGPAPAANPSRPPTSSGPGTIPLMLPDPSAAPE